MTLPASGAISLQDLITEFGGGTKLTDFYRGGARVPATRVVALYGTWSSYFYQYGLTGGGNPYYVRQRTGLQNVVFVWNGATVATLINQGGVSSGAGSVIVGGYQYSAGSYQEVDGEYTLYSIRRRTYSETTESINTDVPTSGAIFLTDFYGATS